ncbi:hypothetical protein BD560DRAFT_70861 [Blakeslea trispora]|nr:hypothetical protein BD560DRAFT_70861 [Blakeslea trispora]
MAAIVCMSQYSFFFFLSFFNHIHSLSNKTSYYCFSFLHCFLKLQIVNMSCILLLFSLLFYFVCTM